MARHEAISKARWLASQKKLAEFWHGEDVLQQELARIQRYYGPALEKYAASLPQNARILDLGCGPICAARFINKGEKVYLDPMLDDYRRAYPGKLPKGKHVVAAYENIPEADASFDLILCIHGLDHAMNPELALNEIDRLLKPHGIFLLGIVVFPGLMARLLRIFESLIPVFRDPSRPYAYTLSGIRRTLSRHFTITEEKELPAVRASEARMGCREYLLVCRKEEQRSSA